MNLSVPQFAHLYSGQDNSFLPFRVVLGINKRILKELLALIKGSIGAL